jgi:WD40 repeat protein
MNGAVGGPMGGGQGGNVDNRARGGRGGFRGGRTSGRGGYNQPFSVQGGYGNARGIQQQPVQGYQGYNNYQQQPGGFQGQGQYDGGNFNGGRGRGGGAAGGGMLKKQIKIASHVQFNPSMVFNVSRFLQGEREAQLSCSALSIVQIPNEAPRVSVYTGDLDGQMREFNFNVSTGAWMQPRHAQHDGPVTCLLIVGNWLFVGVKSPAPTRSLGLVKAYNLVDNSQYVFQDHRGLPAAHLLSVRCICVSQQLLITGGGEGHVKAWSFSANQWNLHGAYGGDAGAHSGEVVAMSAKCAGTLITASAKGDMKSWNPVNGACIADAVQGHIGAIGALDVLSVGQTNFVVTCGEQDGFVRLWSAPALQIMHQITVASPPQPGMSAKPHNPMTAIRIVQVGREQHLFVGFRNGSIQVYHMRDPSNFERLGVVDGHRRQAKIVSIDVVASNGMVCVVTENGDVNWFHLAVDQF